MTSKQHELKLLQETTMFLRHYECMLGAQVYFEYKYKYTVSSSVDNQRSKENCSLTTINTPNEFTKNIVLENARTHQNKHEVVCGRRVKCFWGWLMAVACCHRGQNSQLCHIMCWTSWKQFELDPISKIMYRWEALENWDPPRGNQATWRWLCHNNFISYFVSVQCTEYDVLGTSSDLRSTHEQLGHLCSIIIFWDVLSQSW